MLSARLIENMPAAEYHADPCETPSLSSGIAKILLAKSPRAAFMAHPRLNPNAKDRNPNKFDLGTSAHALLLDETAAGIVVVDADDWRTKAAREARDEAHANGKTALLATDFAAAQEMVEAARKFIAGSEIASDWAAAKSEQTVLWREDGVWLRARPDRLSNDRAIIMDYKTTGDASPETFIRQMVSLGYHIQAEFYRRGVRALGAEPKAFVFIAQETEPPYECALYACDPLLQEIGQFAVDRAIDEWRKALQTNEWRGYGSRVHWATAPAWLRTQHEEIVNG